MYTNVPRGESSPSVMIVSWSPFPSSKFASQPKSTHVFLCQFYLLFTFESIISSSSHPIKSLFLSPASLQPSFDSHDLLHIPPQIRPRPGLHPLNPPRIPLQPLHPPQPNLNQPPILHHFLLPPILILSLSLLRQHHHRLPHHRNRIRPPNHPVRHG